LTFTEETKITLYDGINIIIKMTSMLTQSDITSCRLNSISYHKKNKKIITEMDIQMNYFLIITKRFLMLGDYTFAVVIQYINKEQFSENTIGTIQHRTL
jgi:hypothetical protein